MGFQTHPAGSFPSPMGEASMGWRGGGVHTNEICYVRNHAETQAVPWHGTGNLVRRLLLGV
jgi:hypothetical protein